MEINEIFPYQFNAMPITQLFPRKWSKTMMMPHEKYPSQELFADYFKFSILLKCICNFVTNDISSYSKAPQKMSYYILWLQRCNNMTLLRCWRCGVHVGQEKHLQDMCSNWHDKSWCCCCCHKCPKSCGFGQDNFVWGDEMGHFHLLLLHSTYDS